MRRFALAAAAGAVACVAWLLASRGPGPVRRALGVERGLRSTFRCAIEKRRLRRAAAVPAPPGLAARASRLPRTIAHGGGAWQGRDYTNSVEAVLQSLGADVTTVELDFSWTRDRQLAVVHDWDSAAPLFGWPRHVPDQAEYAAARRADGLTQLTPERLLDLARLHPSLQIVTDVKEDNLAALRALAERAPALRTRLIPQIYRPDEYGPARALGYEAIIFTLYRYDCDDDSVVEFARRQPLLAVTMPVERAAASELPARLAALGVHVYAHTVNDRTLARELAGRGVYGFYSDQPLDLLAADHGGGLGR